MISLKSTYKPFFGQRNISEKAEIPKKILLDSGMAGRV
jgi:hypothetical protein